MPLTNQSRRRWLRSAAALGGGLALARAGIASTAAHTEGRFILVFLRGGLDGLFALAPVADARLSALRPTLARETLASGIRLGNSGFAAHPSARIVAELYASRELAFAPCCGTTDRSRSHFQAQDLFELGNGSSRGGSGFMARAADRQGGRLKTISFSANLPLIQQGGMHLPEQMPLAGSGLQMRQNRALDAIRAMHGQSASGAAIEQAISSQAELESVQGMDPKAARGAAGINGFPRTAETMARILRNNPKISMAFIDIGGFDTHAAQENTLGRSLPMLGEGLLALRNGLGGEEWRKTQVLICTEFGRTVRENGTQGTDHGHGGLALLAGGAIEGGRQIGDFPGLADASLNEGRDLRATVDWRSLIGRALHDTQGFDRAALQHILPGMPGLA